MHRAVPHSPLAVLALVTCNGMLRSIAFRMLDGWTGFRIPRLYQQSQELEELLGLAGGAYILQGTRKVGEVKIAVRR